MKRKQTRWALCAAFLFSAFRVTSQVTLAFQGGEPGDTWGYTSSGASAIAQAEVASPQNRVSGNASLVAGGNTGGGNCWAGGSGNGPSVAREFTFDAVDISSSNESQRTLAFYWGNRQPVCNGTGWDSGENLTFTAYHDGVAQGTVTLATGSNNASFPIDNNQYTWTIPPCVNQFYFVVGVTTNRSDELLFIDDAQLTAPQLNASSGQPSPIAGNTSVCGGTEVYGVLPVAGAIYTWSGLPAGASFTTPNATAASHTISVDWGTAAAGTYTLTVTPSNACGATGTPQTIDVTVGGSGAPVTISGPVTICPGETVVLSSSYATGNTWSPNGETTQTISIAAPGTYEVTVDTGCGTVTDDHVVDASPAPAAAIDASGPLSVCPGGNVVLTASGGDTYQWNGGPAAADYTVGAPGTYMVTATTTCGSDNASVTVTETPLPNAQISGALSFCAGASTTLTASGGDSYQWNGGPAAADYTVGAPGTYTVTATTTCGSDNASVTVTEAPLPNAQISGALSFCAGESTTLTASGGDSYQWNGGPAAADYTVGAPGTYTVTATTTCGSDNASVTVTETPLPDAQISGALSFCAGKSTTLTASGGDSYQWNGGPAAADYAVGVAGAYTVTVTNACGSDAASVTVSESAVVAGFTASAVTGSAPAAISFTNTSEPLTAGFGWDFADGEGSTALHPVHTFTEAGAYTVTLTAENAAGCIDVASLLITVTQQPVSLEVPNVFTPNGDQSNDFFAVSAERIAEYSIAIYNRWGNPVMTSDNVLEHWDGTVNGEPASEGTYFYRIAATGIDGLPYDKSGFVELIR